MIVVFIVLAAVALLAAGATGWLWAVRTTRTAQHSLAEVARAAEQRASAAEARQLDAATRADAHERELATARDTASTVREQLREAQAALTATQAKLANAELDASRTRSSLVEHKSKVAAQQAEIGLLRAQLDADHELGRTREGRAVAEVQRVLAPLIERERLAAELARLEIGRGTRGELPRMMEAIARIGEFSSVVLSDEVGLQLAANREAEDGETLAGVWSMLLAVADRVAGAGCPAPMAVVVHDAANQTILHRLFSSGGSRFLLTAVGRGRTLPAETLDPALGKLERILAGSALAAS